MGFLFINVFILRFIQLFYFTSLIIINIVNSSLWYGNKLTYIIPIQILRFTLKWITLDTIKILVLLFKRCTLLYPMFHSLLIYFTVFVLWHKAFKTVLIKVRNTSSTIKTTYKNVQSCFSFVIYFVQITYIIT